MAPIDTTIWVIAKSREEYNWASELVKEEHSIDISEPGIPIGNFISVNE